MARLAAREGVAITENCAARCLDIAAGRIAGVVHEQGRIACAEVIVAAGAWTALFLGNAGVSLPQLLVRATVAATSAVPTVHDGAAADGDIAFRRRTDGGYTLAPGSFHDFYIGPAAFRNFPKYLPQLRADLSKTRFHPRAPAGYPDAWFTTRRWDGDMTTPFERARVLDPTPNLSKVRLVQDRFAALFPDLPVFSITRAWAGMIDTLPDLVPVVDRVDALPGLTVATGMSGHGFGIGPAIGRILADFVTGIPHGHDLSRFRFNRFSDGSPIDLGAAL
jgi:glycine/D-amino acid oxidase-like deaminating enzyme